MNGAATALTAATATTATTAEAPTSAASAAVTALTAAPVTDPRPPELIAAIQAEKEGRLEEAENQVQAAMAAQPANAEAAHLAGVIAFRQGKREEAVRRMEHSLTLGPPPAYFWRNLCEAYRLVGRLDDALKAGLAAVAGDPKDPVSQINLAVMYYARAEPDLSIAAAKKALAIDANLPGAHFALAEAHLLKGEFGPGWEEYEWRFRLKGVPKLLPDGGPPQWQGEPIPKGRLLLIADQGLGDCIQFARYISWAAERVEEVVVACSREIRPVIEQLAGGATLFDRWEDAPKCVAHLPLSGLPRLYGGDGILQMGPYLRADPEKAAAWKARLDRLAPPGMRRIGIVWAGRPTHNNDANRSTALKTFAPLVARDDATFVSLQKGPPQTQVGDYFGRAPLINLGPEIATFEDTMAILEGLDLLVTVDTSVGHLSAALGRPTWILLPRACDWRWLQERSDTLWYPSVRLFRQKKARVWDDVVAKVGKALDRLA